MGTVLAILAVPALATVVTLWVLVGPGALAGRRGAAADPGPASLEELWERRTAGEDLVGQIELDSELPELRRRLAWLEAELPRTRRRIALLEEHQVEPG